MELKEIFPEFQSFLRDRRLATERKKRAAGDEIIL
jgi:hypothetical protein